MTSGSDRYRPIELPGSLRRVLRAAARWVPRLRRAAWQREWEAELTYAYSRAVADGRSPRRLLFRALWAWLDALFVRKEELTMTRLIADLRLALRGLRRSPVFTVVAIATLALGIGANTAIFSVVNGVLIKPLEYPEPERLVSLNFTAPGLGYPIVPFSEDFYLVMRDGLRAYESIGMYQQDRVNIVGDGDPVQVGGSDITPSVLDVLRVPPQIGRAFNPEDALPGAEPVVLIHDELWRTRYAADPAVLDTMVEMDGRLRRIVGVMPAGFTFPSRDTRVWKPYELDEANPAVGSFSSPGVARLAEGVTLEAGIDDVALTMQNYFDSEPDNYPPGLLEQAQFGPSVTGLKEIIVGDIRQALLVVLGTVGMLLLIACANVANLFLVRAESRQREVSVRAALGAGRSDVARLFLVESLLLSTIGGTVGIGIAFVAVRAFTSSAPVAIPRLSAIGIDTNTLLFTLTVSIVTGLLFGSVPILRTRAADLASALREGGRTSTTSRGGLATRNLLVVAQVALALVLLVGSGLMIRSFGELNSVDPGFDPEGLLAVQIALPRADYPEAAARVAFWRQLREQTAALPGVRAVGAINHVPMGDGRSNGSISIEDHPTEEGALPPLAEKKTVLPGYFQAMGIPLLQGRYLSDEDGIDGSRGVVVSRGFAQHWWPEENPLGKRVRDDSDGDEAEDAGWYEIVGVVGDVHFQALEEPAEETVYYPTLYGSPLDNAAAGNMELILHVDGDPNEMANPVRGVVRQLDPRLPIARVRPVEQLLADSMARTSFTLVMLGAASSIALLLGAIGIYGVISFVVSQRTQEIGVRIALGAPTSTVQSMVVRRGMLLAAIGILVGIAAALGTSSVLASLLYGVSAIDPATYVTVVAALGTVALMASWLPAVRASSVDPVEALRGD